MPVLNALRYMQPPSAMKHQPGCGPRPPCCPWRARSLERGAQELRLKEEAAAELRDGLDRLRADYEDLQGQYAAAKREGTGRERQREMEVRGRGRSKQWLCAWARTRGVLLV